MDPSSKMTISTLANYQVRPEPLSGVGAASLLTRRTRPITVKDVYSFNTNTIAHRHAPGGHIGFLPSR